MSKEVKSLKDKIDYGIYIFQYILLVVSILLLLCNIGVLVFCLYYALKFYYISVIIGIILSISLLISYFTFEKFKFVRKKYRKVKVKKCL